jgi:hypothetical protein
LPNCRRFRWWIDALPVDVEVELSPGALPKTVLAELPKQAASFNLPIILGMLAGSGRISTSTEKKRPQPDHSGWGVW